MGSSNTRWCPTPEQVMVLEELYRRGLRTPSAPQIQKITAHLSLHGHIQGKNVFYWFQNHKARDRQKLRKKLLLLHHHRHNFHLHSLSHSHPQNIIPFHQGSGVCEEAPVMRTYGHDSMMIKEAGPTQLPCKPIQTLQLFPLTSPTTGTAAATATANHPTTPTSSFLNAYP